MAKKRSQKSRSFSATAPSPIVNIADKRSVRAALQPNRKEGMFISVPTVSGKVHFSIAMSFGRAMASSSLKECPYIFSIHAEAGKRPIDFARNCIVKTFMEQSDADWLVMVDEDQVIPDNFWQLCTVKDADIVSGLTPVWVGNMDAEASLRVNNYGLDDNAQCYNLPAPDASVKQPYRVPILGTGCIAIRRRVFAPKPHGLGVSPFYFTYQDDRKIMAGEDINFSVEANKLGFVLAVHPQVWFDHVKEIPLMQIETYYNARRKMETEGRQVTEKQRLSIG